MDLRPKLVFLMVLAVFLAVSGANLGSGVASASLAATFNVTPQTALPNQTVLLLGTGFSQSTTSGGAGFFGAHQVTGFGGSVVSVGDVPLASPNVTYPIDFDGDGSWTASEARYKAQGTRSGQGRCLQQGVGPVRRRG